VDSNLYIRVLGLQFRARWVRLALELCLCQFFFFSPSFLWDACLIYPVIKVPFSLLQFPLYEKLKSQAAKRRSLPSSDQLPAHISAICGSIAGATAAALTTPLDVIKTRIMLTKQKHGARIGIPESFARVYREEGWPALWKGIVPRTIWIGLGGAVFLGVYEVSIQQLGSII
jgi:solute carrier family 25 S-adenosylmethionine transporter 26